MLTHIVIFWLKDGLTIQEREVFEKELFNLRQIPSIDQVFIGKPASTPKRPVIDDSYDFCLTVILKDLAAHDKYQEDEIHLGFIEACSHMWERVEIYDAE